MNCAGVFFSDLPSLQMFFDKLDIVEVLALRVLFWCGFLDNPYNQMIFHKFYTDEVSAHHVLFWCEGLDNS